MAKAMTARACRMQSSTVRRIQEVSTTALQRSVANQCAAELLRGSWRDLACEQRVCFELSTGRAWHRLTVTGTRSSTCVIDDDQEPRLRSGQ
jgi:hypothetical protein